MSTSAQAKDHPAMAIDPQVSLDLCGVASPGPLPTIKKAMATLRDGQILQLFTNFPGIEEDLFCWAKQTNNQLLFIDKTHEKSFAFYLLKGDPWKTDKVLDTSGAHCPTPVIEAARCLSRMEAGQTIKLISTCEASPTEVDTWVRSTKHNLLGMTEDARGAFRFYIRK